MKKFGKFLAAILSLALLLQVAAFPAVAVEVGEVVDGIMALANSDIIDSGYCGGEGDGTNLSWTLTNDGTLTISGNGKMSDFLRTNKRESINKIVIESGVTSVGNMVFGVCSSLTSVTIPSSVTSIGEGAFMFCERLLSIEIPNSVTSIGSNAFNYCTSLTSVTIPDSVTSIGVRAFYSCQRLTSITVSSGNQYYCSIDGVLFSKDGTTLVCYPAGKRGMYVIPNGVKSIGDSAFINCNNLTSIEIPSSVTSIGNNAFQFCLFMTSVSIPNSVTSIGSYAFYCCSKLTSIEIPSSVTSIGDGAFGASQSISQILVDNVNPSYCSIDGVLFSKDESELVCYPAGKQGTLYIIPNSVTSIGSDAFSNCTGLTSVTIPNSVTSIGNSAFYGCTDLTSVTIPNSVTSIGSGAFSYCSNLTSIEIPNSVTIMGGEVFKSCENLSDIYCEAESKSNQWNENWINNCSATIHWGYKCGSSENIIASGYCGGEGDGTNLSWTLTDDGTLTISGNGKMEIYDAFNSYSVPAPWYEYHSRIRSVEFDGSVTSIGDYAFSGCEGLTSIIIPNSVISIGDSAFYYCTSLTSIEIPNSVTSIDRYAFYGCTSLTSISIPISITRIRECTFFGCTSLTSIKIPNSVTVIEEESFRSCWRLSQILVDDANPSYCSIDGIVFSKDRSELVCYPAGKQRTSYEIPNSVTSICGYAFAGCYMLTSIEIPNSVISIGKSAFESCTSIISIEIPNSVTSVGWLAFQCCTSLTSVIIPNSVTSIEDSAFNKCESLTSIEIPNSVTSMGGRVFANCTSLTDIYCEAESKPSGWGSEWLGDWNDGCSATVHWGYKPLYGDLDGNGEVDESETVEILGIVKGITAINQQYLQAADFNKDGRIDIRDFNYIYNIIMQK